MGAPTAWALPAVEAYYSGWQATGAPLDGRAFLGAAAVLLAEDGTPTHWLGHMDGTWAVIHDRRDDVHRRNQREIGAAAGPVLDRLNAEGLAAEVWAMTHLATGPRAAETLDPDVRAELDSRIAAVVAELPGSEGWQQLREALAEGGAHGTAEGVTDALAAIADGMGRNIDWDIAFTDAWQAMDTADFLGPADGWLAEFIGGLRGDLGRALAGVMSEGGTYEQLLAAAQGVIGARPVRSVQYVVDVLTGRSLTDGMLSVYRRVGAQELDFVTAGDQRVCTICAGYEADSPYPAADAPPPCPAHGFCRCVIQARDWGPLDAADVVGLYLTTDDEPAEET